MEAHDGSLTEQRIKEILYEKGIAYSVVQKTDKTHIDAASFYVKDFPAVVTTHRYNDMSMLILMYYMSYGILRIIYYVEQITFLYLQMKHIHLTANMKKKQIHLLKIC